MKKLLLFATLLTAILTTGFRLAPGTIDLYQALVMLAAHSERHTLQIEEVMADPNFPKQ